MIYHPLTKHKERCAILALTIMPMAIGKKKVKTDKYDIVLIIQYLTHHDYSSFQIPTEQDGQNCTEEGEAVESSFLPEAQYMKIRNTLDTGSYIVALKIKTGKASARRKFGIFPASMILRSKLRFEP